MKISNFILKVIKRLNFELLGLVSKIENNLIYKTIINILSILFRYKIRIVSIDKNFLKLKEKKSNTSIFICYKNRLDFYINGINFRLKNLVENEYLIQNIDLAENSVVFDIGANIGEFGLFLRKKYKNIFEYHAFEPSKHDYDACCSNNKDGKNFINNIGLWNTPGNMKLYNKNITGDSSLIEMDNYKFVTEIAVDTIDNYSANHNIKNIKILKIEAEGGEPEILEGALKTLPKVEYITADLGYERGYKKEQTFTAFTNILMSKGFEMIDVFQDRLTVIFKNKLLF